MKTTIIALALITTLLSCQKQIESPIMPNSPQMGYKSEGRTFPTDNPHGINSIARHIAVNDSAPQRIAVGDGGCPSCDLENKGK